MVRACPHRPVFGQLKVNVKDPAAALKFYVDGEWWAQGRVRIGMDCVGMVCGGGHRVSRVLDQK